MAKFDFSDASVVLITGSGAGGGTLANELCQKSIKVVALEAGALQSSASFVHSPDNISIQLLQHGQALGPAKPWQSMPNIDAW